MDLISQIVNELIDDSKSLNGALLKTKVLASRIGNQELLDWTNAELSGYTKKDILPEYRKNIANSLKGTVINFNTKYSNQEIPTSNLDKALEFSLRHTNFTVSISALESLINQNTNVLVSAISAELTHQLEVNWVNMGNPYLSIVSCNRIITKGQIVAVIANVRSKLLDFMLAIETEFGESVEIKDLLDKNKKITTMMHHTIINNNGSGNSINTGNDNLLSNGFFGGKSE